MADSAVSFLQRTPIVDKPWGHEEIFALVGGRFCGKTLHVRAGHSLSLQYDRENEGHAEVLAS
jgi:mannose-6-phosphate isomerase